MAIPSGRGALGVMAALLLVAGSGAGLAQGPAAPTAAPGPASTPLDPAKLTAADFAQLPFVESPVISPDGTRFAGFFAVDGKQMIGIFSLFDQNTPPIKIGIPDSTQKLSIFWVNDDNIVLRLRALEPFPGGQKVYIYRLLGINRNTGKITKLLWDVAGQNAANILWLPSDGSTKILVAAQGSFRLGSEFWPSAWRVDVETGSKFRELQGRENIMDWDTDASGSIRTGYKYGDGGRKFTLLYRGEGSQGAFRLIERADSRKQERLLRPFLFLPGTDRAIAHREDANGQEGIYEIDLSTREELRTLYEAPSGTEIGRIRLSADGHSLLGISTTSSEGGQHWFDARLTELQAQFDRAVGTRRARIVSLSRDLGRMLVVVDRADSPGGIFFYDVKDGTLRRVADMNPLFARRFLSPVKVVRYKARDGLEIEALLTLPKGVEPRNLPMVMMPHGGPWGQDTLNYNYMAQFVASRGYAVMQPNYRGSTGYGTEFVRRGEGQMGLAMQDDLTDGLNWAVEQGIANPARVCIVGVAYGGYAAMWGIAKDPDQYRCAISISGVANLRREVNDFGQYLNSAKYKDDWQKMTPDFAAVSPINAIAQMKAPLMLIHGKKDVTVDHGQSTSMHSRMKAAGKSVEFVSLPEADHYFTRQEDRLALLSAIEAFLARHNPAGARAAAK